MPGMVLDAEDRRINKTYLHSLHFSAIKHTDRIQNTQKQMEETNQSKDKKDDDSVGGLFVCFLNKVLSEDFSVKWYLSRNQNEVRC